MSYTGTYKVISLQANFFVADGDLFALKPLIVIVPVEVHHRPAAVFTDHRRLKAFYHVSHHIIRDYPTPGRIVLQAQFRIGLNVNQDMLEIREPVQDLRAVNHRGRIGVKNHTDTGLLRHMESTEERHPDFKLIIVMTLISVVKPVELIRVDVAKVICLRKFLRECGLSASGNPAHHIQLRLTHSPHCGAEACTS